MKKNKKLCGVIIFGLCLGVYITAFNGEEYRYIERSPVAFEKDFESFEKGSDRYSEAALSEESTSAPKREPASIPRPALAPEWEIKLKERLKHTMRTWDAEPKVKSLGAKKLKNGKGSLKVEHVIVSIDQGDGNVSSYEAYVHPKTGAILKTWNQTRFENKEPIVLKARPLRTL